MQRPHNTTTPSRRTISILPLLLAALLALSLRPQRRASGAEEAAGATGTPAGAAVPPKPYGPLPSERQLRWQALEFIGFCHFTVNTFTDKEWGYGDEDEKVFNPTDFDADQIASAAADAGMKELILTCKHHDGFCLWPSALTEHSVKNSPWRDGKGDVVKELSDACRKQGLKFGVYLSPWDRNNKAYGTPAYLDYYRGQLRELLTHYGEVSEVWFDGANGGDGYYGGAREKRHIDNHTYYDWPNTWKIVRALAPGAVMFSDAGPDVRWVGNENGTAGDPCWATLDLTAPGRQPGGSSKGLTTGERPGTDWVPAECDVSIRPGWFYHAAEDDKVKTPAQLMDLYFKSVGRGAVLNVNVPPDRRGQLHEQDVKSLHAFGDLLRATFAQDLARGATASANNVRGGANAYAASHVIDGDRDTYWSCNGDAKSPELVLEWPKPVTFNVVRLREFLPLGQRIEAFALDQWEEAKADGGEAGKAAGHWKEFAAGTSIGNCRLLRVPPVTTRKLRLRVTQAPVCPAISEIGVFAAPDAEGGRP